MDFQPGIHFINLIGKIEWLIGPSNNVTLIGNDNVTIYCLSHSTVSFRSVQHVSMSNIHFKNCCGEYGSTSLFLSHPRVHTSISLESIKITNEVCEGIKVTLGKKGVKSLARKIRIFHLMNSILSPGDNGLSTIDSEYKSKDERIVKISNVLFNSSCLSIISVTAPKYSSRSNTYSCTVMNATFVGYTCSPALSFRGVKDIAKSDVAVYNTHSQHLMYIMGSFGIVSDTFYFYNNTGAVVVGCHSNLEFHDAIIKFVNNTISDDNISDIIE